MLQQPNPRRQRAKPGWIRKRIGALLELPPAADRYARLRRIEQLDPVRDCVEVYHLMLEDFQVARQFMVTAGFFMTYAVPPISRILRDTEELQHRILKRLVDTMLLGESFHKHGFAPGPGRDAIRRVNQMHRKYPIRQKDFAGIGCMEVFTNVWFAETYGWRPVTAAEKTAAAAFNKQLAINMGHGPAPDTYEDCKQFFMDYLDSELGYEPQNKMLADNLMTFLVADTPAFLRPVMRDLFLAAGYDDRIIVSCGYSPPNRLMKILCRLFLRVFARLDPCIDGPSAAALRLVRRVYPNGYQIKKLGTHVSAIAEERHTPMPESGLTLEPSHAASTV